MTNNPDEQPAKPDPDEEAPAAPATVESSQAAPAADGETPDVSLAGEAMNLLSEHKGKLAIGVAATLGMMVYYGWREKRLEKIDPEEYARLQRLKAVVRHSDEQPKSRPARKNGAAQPAGPQAAQGAQASDAPAEPDSTPDSTPDIS